MKVLLYPYPPLCRCAERTTDLILAAWRMFSRCALTISVTGNATGMHPLCALEVRCPGAWGEWRSGIKEESAALSRHGGQPRSQSPQVPGRTQTRWRKSLNAQ